MVLAGTVEPGDKVVVGLADGKLDFRVERGAGPSIEEAERRRRNASPQRAGAGRSTQA